MQHAKAEFRFESIEVSIAVDKSVPGLDAESCDKAVYGFANGVAAGTKEAIVTCGGYSEGRSSGFKNFKTRQVPLQFLEHRVVANTLQDFAEYEIDEGEGLPS
jgi:hypothetical protein